MWGHKLNAKCWFDQETETLYIIKIYLHIWKWVKTFWRLVILKLNKINFVVTLGDVDIENVLVSENISSSEKKYKYFIGYFDNNHKVKPWHTMHQKLSAYVKRYDRKTKWMYFFIKDDDLLQKYNTIWDKSKKNLIARLSTIKFFWKSK